MEEIFLFSFCFWLLVVGFPTFQHALTIPNTPNTTNLGWRRFQFEAVQSQCWCAIAEFRGAKPVVLTDTPTKFIRAAASHPSVLKFCDFMCFFLPYTSGPPTTYLPQLQSIMLDCNLTRVSFMHLPPLTWFTLPSSVGPGFFCLVSRLGPLHLEGRAYLMPRNASYAFNLHTKITKGCFVSHCDLAIYIKRYIKAKEEIWKLKYLTMQKYNL